MNWGMGNEGNGGLERPLSRIGANAWKLRYAFGMARALLAGVRSRFGGADDLFAFSTVCANLV